MTAQSVYHYRQLFKSKKLKANHVHRNDIDRSKINAFLQGEKQNWSNWSSVGREQAASCLCSLCTESSWSQDCHHLPPEKTIIHITFKVTHIQPRLKGQTTPKTGSLPLFLHLSALYPSTLWLCCPALSCFGLVSCFSGVVELGVTQPVASDAPKTLNLTNSPTSRIVLHSVFWMVDSLKSRQQNTLLKM